MRGLALLALIAAGSAAAGDVTSLGPEAVGLTLYHDGVTRAADLRRMSPDDNMGLAMIVERRTVDLPAGRSRVRFQGVAEGIIPASAAVDGLPGAVVERNFDYDLLTPASLLGHAVGEPVHVVRTDARTGRETTLPAVIQSGPDGLLLDYGGRVEAPRCGGEAERIVFDHAPAGLTDRPTLSVVADAPRAGRHEVVLRYLATRMAWSADYVARVAPGGGTLTLTGWITLANPSSTAFEAATTSVIAGRLARVPVDRPTAKSPTLEAGCWGGQTTHSDWAERMLKGNPAPPPPPPMAAPMVAMRSVVVTAQKRVIESQLGDYKLYTLTEPTTVAARQTKQVLLFEQPEVRFDTVYAYDSWVDEPTGQEAARVVLRFKNTVAQGLGRAIPAGWIALRRPGPDGHDLFAGERELPSDISVGEPFEIDAGAAQDVTVTHTVTESGDTSRQSRRAFAITATNAKATPVTVEIRQRRGFDGFKVTTESRPHDLKSGDPVWRLTVPPGAESALTYAIEFRRG